MFFLHYVNSLKLSDENGKFATLSQYIYNSNIIDNMKKMLFFIMTSCVINAFVLVSCVGSDTQYPYTFYSIKVFDDTDVEELARYVKKNDTIKIRQFLRDNPDVDIDTRDQYFGSSLLMWAIFNDKYESFHCLLQCGANPNFRNHYHLKTPLVYASEAIDDNYNYDVRYCKELLEHGADVNVNDGEPIINATWRCLPYVKVLVEYGADLTVGKDVNCSPANHAIIHLHPDIAEYLIIEKKTVLYKEPSFKNWINDPEMEKSKKRIQDYLEKHPEQKCYEQNVE